MNTVKGRVLWNYHVWQEERPLRFPVFFFLAFFLIGFPLDAQSTAPGAGILPPVSQEEKEAIPQWVKDLWRADIIFFGSFPLMYFWSATFVDTYRASQHDWDARYLPWPAKGAGAVPMTEDEHIITIAAAAGGSLLAALIDHLIVRIKRDRANKAAARLPPGDPVIIRKPWPEAPAGEVPPGLSPEADPDAAAGDRED
jgi:hypothetical protein